jgi:hypothetical protein
MCVCCECCVLSVSPRGRTPIQTGAALGVKPGARTTVTPLTVWAAQLLDAKVPRGCENQDRTHQRPVALTKTNYIYKDKQWKYSSNTHLLSHKTEKVIQKTTTFVLDMARSLSRITQSNTTKVPADPLWPQTRLKKDSYSNSLTEKHKPFVNRSLFSLSYCRV